MKKIGMATVMLLVCGSVMADTFYLHENMATGNSPLFKTNWWTEATGGVQMSTEPIAGNRFDLNGKTLVAPNSTGTSTFGGTLVVGAAGSGGPTELLTAGWNVTGMDFNNAILMRLRKTTVNLSVANMVLGSSGNLSFRTHTDTSKNLTLAVDNLSGSGILSFGEFSATDTTGAWTVSVTNGNSFDGTMDLQYGQLTFGNSLSLTNTAFTMQLSAAFTNSVVLANSVTFKSATIGTNILAAGTYTASQLNTAFGTTKFSGANSLTVIPEPATIGMVGFGALVTLIVRRVYRKI
jgi:hypothetical protein